MREIQDTDRHWQNQRIVMDSIGVLQSQRLEGRSVELVRFEAVRDDSLRQECLFTYQVQRRWGQWAAQGAGGGCGPVGGDGSPVGVGWGQQGGGTSRPALSHVDGLVHDASVETVQVTWTDGEEQQAQVINDSYLALRWGAFELEQVQALDAAGEVIYTFEPSPAPGKQ